MAPKYPDCKDPDSMGTHEKLVKEMKILFSNIGIALSMYKEKLSQFEMGENLQGIEIKTDMRMEETGRLSIEYAEKSKASNYQFIPSGILRNDNTWCYVQSNFHIAYVFSKVRLLEIYNDLDRNKYRTHELPTIKKFYLPISDADSICLFKGIKDGDDWRIEFPWKAYHLEENNLKDDVNEKQPINGMQRGLF